MTVGTPAEVVAACAAASAFCLGISLVPARNPLSERLARLARVTERSTNKRLERIELIIKAETRSRLRDRLNAAGWYRVAIGSLMLRGVAGLLGGLALGVLLTLVLSNKALALILGVLVAAVGWRLPKIVLDRAIKARRDRVARDLPDFLDILASTVRAGLALNGALVHAAESVAGPLHEELASALAEIRLGRPRSDALKGLAERINEPSTRTMVTSIIQAERLGANLATVLHELALDTRNQRWMLAEERAAQIPVKMVFPMALLMLPSLYIMIFTPVVAKMFVP
jgi:tight adherence protein C